MVSAGVCEGKRTPPICHTDGRAAEAVTVNRMSKISGAEKGDCACGYYNYYYYYYNYYYYHHRRRRRPHQTVSLRSKQTACKHYVLLEYTKEHSKLRFSAGNIFLFSKRPHQLEAHSGFYSMNTGCPFPAGKADGGVKLATRQHFFHRGKATTT